MKSEKENTIGVNPQLGSDKAELASRVSSLKERAGELRVEVESKNAEIVAFGVHRDILEGELASQKVDLEGVHAM